ncbi:MAG: endonuclease/exonuclease/phosphatase family protein [Chloroflexota bacterium]|nr:endonuclease/exonuclease/phosphatase family protein [Chloroflexota bacterium]
MPTTMRVATFNCENLFSRPKIFFESARRSSELLGYVSELQAALQSDVIDHARIQSLKSKLKGYAAVSDIRGKHKKAGGAADWLGFVELARSEINDVAVENTARVIRDVNADVICLIEVENRILLQKFHDNILYKKFLKGAKLPGYRYNMLIDGNDERGIDVSVMSRLPILWLRSHVHERTMYDGREVPTFSRDCLEVQVESPDGNPIHLLVNHFKSMGYSSPRDPQSNRRRLGQSKRVADLVGEHNLLQAYVVVAGDLNSDPSSPSLAPLVNKAGLYNINLELASSERGTYKSGNKQLDYLFVSDALKQRLQAVRIERRGMFVKKWPHYAEVTSDRTAASDHAAVVADFQL